MLRPAGLQWHQSFARRADCGTLTMKTPSKFVKSEAPTAGEKSESAKRSSWSSIVLLAALTAAGMASLNVFNPLQDLVKSELGLSDVQVGFLQGAAGALPIMMLSIPLGIAVDSVRRVRLLLLLMLIGAAGTLLTATARSFPILFLARVLITAGTTCNLIVILSLIADLSVKGQRGIAQTLIYLGKLIGAVTAFSAGGALLAVLRTHPSLLPASMAAWRGVHCVFFAFNTLLVLLIVLVREPVRHECDRRSDANWWSALRAVWQRRALLAPLFFGSVVISMADAAASIWASPVLIRNYRQQPEQFGGWMGLTILISGVIGAALGGHLADLGQKRKIPGGILGATVAGAAISIPASFFPVMPAIPGFALLFALLMIGGSIAALGTTTALTILLPNELRGVCLGLFLTVESLFGLGIAPSLVATLSRWLGGEDHLAQALAAVGAITSSLALAGFVVAVKSSQRRPA